MSPDPNARRSAVASMLSASLEMARDGDLEINQAKAFAPVFIRKTTRAEQGQETQNE
jgi:segregation and condensation protein A